LDPDETPHSVASHLDPNCLQRPLKFGSSTERVKQIIGVPMGTNCAPLTADLFLYCYESEFMLELSKTKQVDLIHCFNLISRYIDDILNLDNPLFEQYIHKIYPKELVLNRSCISNTDAAYLDLHLTINNTMIKTSLYDKRDDFNFEIV